MCIIESIQSLTAQLQVEDEVWKEPPFWTHHYTRSHGLKVQGHACGLPRSRHIFDMLESSTCPPLHTWHKYLGCTWSKNSHGSGGRDGCCEIGGAAVCDGFDVVLNSRSDGKRIDLRSVEGVTRRGADARVCDPYRCSHLSPRQRLDQMRPPQNVFSCEESVSNHLNEKLSVDLPSAQLGANLWMCSSLLIWEAHGHNYYNKLKCTFQR